jgi:hypothetical protein
VDRVILSDFIPISRTDRADCRQSHEPTAVVSGSWRSRLLHRLATAVACDDWLCESRDMKIAFGADDENECTRAVVEHLRGIAHLRVLSGSSWPEFARESQPS